MKKVLLVLLSVCIILGSTGINVLAAGGGTQLGMSAQNTKQGTAPTASNFSATMNKGTSFYLTFKADSIQWSATGTGYEPTIPLAWVGLNDGAKPYFTVKAANVNPTTGDITVQIEAAAATNGAISMQVFLEGAVTGKTAQRSREFTNNAVTINETVRTVNSTKAGGNQGTSVDGNPVTVNIGQTLRFRFDQSNFNWSATTGTMDTSRVTSGWVKLSGATLGTDFAVSAVNDQGNGTVEVVLSARKAGTYSGLSVSLQGGTGGAQTRASQSVNVTVNDPTTTSTISKTVGGGTAGTCISHSGAVNLAPGETLQFSFAANNFEWNPASGTKNASALTDTSWIKLRNATVGTDFNVAYSTPSGSTGEVRVTLTALKAGTYNNLQVYLQGGTGGAATTYSESKQVMVASSGTTTINGISGDAQIGGKWSGAYLNGKAISYDALGSLEVNLDDELLIPFDAGFFTWEGTTPYSGSAVTSSQLSRGKIKVATSNKKGTAAFKSGTFELVSKNGRAYLKVQFADAVTSTKDIDFSVDIYLSVNGRRDTGSYLRLAGELVRDLVEIDSDEDYVDISDGSIVEASSYSRNVELYLGSGISVVANLTTNKKYSGTAKYEVSSADEKVLDRYPSIEEVIVLSTTNLSGGKVIMDLDEVYYVYNSEGKYVGRSNEKLAYSSKYYLSTKRIDMGSGSEDPDDGYDRVPVPGGGNDVTPAVPVPPANNSDNPYTGRAY